VVLIVPSLVTERIESIKAGIIGAGAFIIAELTILIVKDLDLVNHLLSEANLANMTLLAETWLVQLIIGAVSGFLFGVAYRYIIRDDRNSHLNDGAVLAFGLVRGLALIEKNLVIAELLSVLLLIIQSIVCFAIARLVIDLAIARKFIKPFV